MDAWLIGDDITGEARLVGARHARMVIRYLERGWIRKRPCVLLTGGETTVTRTGAGKGGRNSEYLAGFFAEIKGHPGIWALAADTDGIDGSEYNAGAFITPESWTKALDLNVDAYLANNDCYSFFERLGGLLITGPTCTNVNDFRAIYIA